MSRLALSSAEEGPIVRKPSVRSGPRSYTHTHDQSCSATRLNALTLNSLTMSFTLSLDSSPAGRGATLFSTVYGQFVPELAVNQADKVRTSRLAPHTRAECRAD